MLLVSYNFLYTSARGNGSRGAFPLAKHRRIVAFRSEERPRNVFGGASVDHPPIGQKIRLTCEEVPHVY